MCVKTAKYILKYFTAWSPSKDLDPRGKRLSTDKNDFRDWCKASMVERWIKVKGQGQGIPTILVFYAKHLDEIQMKSLLPVDRVQHCMKNYGISTTMRISCQTIESMCCCVTESNEFASVTLRGLRLLSAKWRRRLCRSVIWRWTAAHVIVR